MDLAEWLDTLHGDAVSARPLVRGTHVLPIGTEPWPEGTTMTIEVDGHGWTTTTITTPADDV